MDDSLGSQRNARLQYYTISQVIGCLAVQSHVTYGQCLVEVICQQLLTVEVEHWEISLEKVVVIQALMTRCAAWYGICSCFSMVYRKAGGTGDRFYID